MIWNEAALRELRALWALWPSVSTAEIGRRLGCSKNAVVGKAHRFGLPARPSPIRRPAGWKPGTPAIPSIPRAPMATLPALPSETKAIVESILAEDTPDPLAAQIAQRIADIWKEPERPKPEVKRRTVGCYWPIGEPGAKNFRFCDDLAIAGKPYCLEHAKLAYIRVRDRKVDADA